MNRQTKFVTILGEVWKIEFKDIGNVDEDGHTEWSTRTIVIRNDNTAGIPTFEQSQKSWLRHEIIHAFHFESGLAFNYEHKSIGIDETEVDWFAIQYPKMKKVFAELECED